MLFFMKTPLAYYTLPYRSNEKGDPLSDLPYFLKIYYGLFLCRTLVLRSLILCGGSLLYTAVTLFGIDGRVR